MKLSPEFQTQLESLETKYRDVPTGSVVFFGSSSIRLWPVLARAFPAVTIENWGFGGSTLAECAEVFEHFIGPRRPRALVIYAGDNDLARGANPEAVWRALVELLDARDVALGAIPFAFLSLKIAPARASLRNFMEGTNVWCQREIWGREAAQWVDIATPMLDENKEPRIELFAPDLLHLSRAGYDVWNETLRREVSWLV